MDNYLVIGTEIDTKGFDKQIKEIEYQLKQIDYELSHKKELNLDSRTITEYESKAQKLGNQLEKLREKQAQMNTQGFTNIKTSIDSVGSSVENVTRKIGRWVIAVFGVRTAMNFVRSSMNTIIDGDAQLKADIDYMKIALAYTLEPVVRGIVNLMKTLMFYVAYIVKAWTGRNIFAKANEGLAKTNSGLKKSVGSTKALNKELNKTTASFDEMNTLQDNKASSGGGGGGADVGGGGVTPSFDFGDFDKMEVPGWLKWIVDHKDEIIALFFGIVAAIAAIKLGLGGIKALGIGIMVYAVVKFIQDLLKYLKDPTWENLGRIIQDIGIFIIGLGITIGSIPAIIIGAIVLIVGTIIKYWDEIKSFFEGIIKWLSNAAKNVGGIPGMIIQSVADMIQNIINSIELFIKGIQDVLDGLIKFVKDIFSGNIKGAIDGLLQILKGLVEMFFGSLGVMWSAVWGLIKAAILLIVNIFVELVGSVWNLIKGLWNLITGLLKTVASWIYNIVIKPIANFFVGLWNGIINGVKNAFNTIKNVFKSIISFFSSIVNSILGLFRKIGVNVGNVIGGAFKGVINGVLKAIESILNFPIKAINKLIGVINKVPGVNLGKLNTFNLPRLAKGGIINQPGRGIPVGGAIAGERGQEGVIPLTDSQQMALLGEAIGKYITINANITNTMNGRVISRELQKIQNESDFAYNR